MSMQWMDLELNKAALASSGKFFMKEADAHGVCWMSVASANRSNRGLVSYTRGMMT